MRRGVRFDSEVVLLVASDNGMVLLIFRGVLLIKPFLSLMLTLFIRCVFS